MEPERELPPELVAAVDRLDDLVHAFEQHPDAAVKERAFELLQCDDIVHRAGMRRLGELLTMAGLQRRALDDPEVRLLFDMYDLGEGGERIRAEAVLDGVRPYIESHGGRLEVVAAEAGVVTLRLSGSCHGCHGSAATLHHVIEQALHEGLPDFIRLDALEPPPSPPANFIPLSNVAMARPRLSWRTVLRVSELPPGSVRGLDVEGSER
mgnify:CR=1 FL=1